MGITKQHIFQVVVALVILSAALYYGQVSKKGDTALVDGTWTWTKTEYTDGRVFEDPSGGRFVLSFDTDQRTVSSTSDCNSFFGSYQLQGNKLMFGPLASTKMFCVGSVESEYGQNLSEVISYEITGNTLFLILDEGGKMLFEQVS